MRVLVIANLPPHVLGGAENQVARLVETWVDMSHQIEVAGHRIPDGREQLGTAHFRTHHLAVINRAGRLGKAVSYFISMAILLHRLKNRFDIVYCRGLGDGAISVCLLKALGAIRIPLVICPINARGTGDSYFLRSIPGWKWVVPLINKHCEAINIIAPAIQADMTELGICRPKITHIPNGIKLATPIRRSRFSSVRRLIWTGRMTAQKGVDVLLQALGNVAASGRGFSLEIVGEGPDKVELLSQCKNLRLEDKVHFAGALGREMIRSKLAEHEIFVLPSRYEGMSNAALEAMEAGLPVLLTRCGGIDTYIDKNIGWLCEPNDVEGLTTSLQRMLDTPVEKLIKMGIMARQLVENHFQVEEISRQNIALFATVISSHN